MSKEPGRNIEISIGDGGTPTEIFTKIGRMQLRRLRLSQIGIDVTDQASTGRWRELLAKGLRSARIEGLGEFRHSPAEDSVRAAFFAGTKPNFRFELGRWGRIEGPFLVLEMDFQGRLEENFAVSLIFESSGELSWIAS